VDWRDSLISRQQREEAQNTDIERANSYIYFCHFISIFNEDWLIDYCVKKYNTLLRWKTGTDKLIAIKFRRLQINSNKIIRATLR
jgi:hypothetical protein